MTLTVHTARIGPRLYDDELNVSRATGAGDGLAFAPSWDLLRPVLEHRSLLRTHLAASQPLLVSLEHAAWRLYERAFHAEMRESYRRQRIAWDRLLARTSVTLLCFCTDPAHCHRTLLARDILPKLGAVFAGERAPAKEPAPTLPGVGG